MKQFHEKPLKPCQDRTELPRENPASESNPESDFDRFHLFYEILTDLEDVMQHPKRHPEGDVLYHSLQVFDLACDRYPYDFDFLMAALLHDIGKGIHLCDANCQKVHVCHFDRIFASLEVLLPHVSETTAWFIRYLREAHRIQNGSIGARLHRKLKSHQCYGQLLELMDCDIAGRKPGVETTTLDKAIEYLRQIEG